MWHQYPALFSARNKPVGVKNEKKNSISDVSTPWGTPGVLLGGVLGVIFELKKVTFPMFDQFPSVAPISSSTFSKE